jgi:hypothetical protein
MQLMNDSSQTTRIICNDLELADQLRQLLVHIAPDCEVLSAPSDCSAVPFAAGSVRRNWDQLDGAGCFVGCYRGF